MRYRDRQADRWSWRFDTPSPNPGAGVTVGTPLSERSTEMGETATSKAGDWHPTVLNLAVLVLLEIAGYAALRYAFRAAHGG